MHNGGLIVSSRNATQQLWTAVLQTKAAAFGQQASINRTLAEISAMTEQRSIRQHDVNSQDSADCGLYHHDALFLPVCHRNSSFALHSNCFVDAAARAHPRRYSRDRPSISWHRFISIHAASNAPALSSRRLPSLSIRSWNCRRAGARIRVRCDSASAIESFADSCAGVLLGHCLRESWKSTRHPYS